MTIVGCRIDGRLIHGQVANLWTTKLNVSRIMVIDDEVAQNDIEKSGLKLATPPGVKLSILPVAKAAENILAGKYDSQRLFIVARGGRGCGRFQQDPRKRCKDYVSDGAKRHCRRLYEVIKVKENF